MFSVPAQECHILIIFVPFKRTGQNSSFYKESIQGIFIKIVVAPLFGKHVTFEFLATLSNHQRQNSIF